jgi:hypothetical protein
METIQELKEKISQDTSSDDNASIEDDDSLTRRLEKISINLIHSNLNSTESIGHRNVRAHRRVQSTTLFSILDSPRNMRHRVRSLSLAECPEPPSLDKYYPGSHLLDSTNAVVDYSSGNTIYLSLWLLPPLPLRKNLLKDIAKLAMRYSAQGSSAPFMPHVTIVGSIACSSLREATELGVQLKKGLESSGPVPCRFDRTRGCLAMYKEEQTEQAPDDSSSNNNNNNNDSSSASLNGTKPTTTPKRHLVWSQSCIAVMERSDEFMNVLALSRQVLKLPPGECTYSTQLLDLFLFCFERLDTWPASTHCVFISFVTCS